MRNDAVLNTGLSSAIDRRIQAKTKQRIQEKQQARAVLTKSDELIIAEITKARKELREEAFIKIDSDMTEKQVQIIREGFKYADDKMNSLQARLLNLLRVGVKSEQ